ncbi:unannotated protein [freshwater metagenome]|uniref:Unannotated protein n=1 Tax=freshwater metagenome TaxID=449393 RepID=A0A6J6QE98_9ZZZZ
MIVFFMAPLASVVLSVAVPKSHAHLSAFSYPAPSYQALPSGSEAVSTNSCAITDAIASAIMLELGEAAICPAHEATNVPGSPTNEDFTFVPFGADMLS